MKKMKFSVLMVLVSVLWIACDPKEEVGPKAPDELGDLTCSFNGISLNEEEKSFTANDANLITSYEFNNTTTFGYEYNEDYRLTELSNQESVVFDVAYSGDEITTVSLDGYSDSYAEIISALNSGNGTVAYTSGGMDFELVMEDNLVKENNSLSEDFSLVLKYSEDTYKNVNEKFVVEQFLQGNVSDLIFFMSYLQNNDRVLESVSGVSGGEEFRLYSLEYSNDEELNKTTVVVNEENGSGTVTDTDTFVFDYDCGE